MTIDILPTLAAFTGAKLPDLKIDGRNSVNELMGTPREETERRLYATWYSPNNLESVTDGRWKLMVPGQYRTMGDQPKAKDGIPGKYRQAKIEAPELYDLTADISEATNLADKNPEVVATLTAFANKMRAELGDGMTKTPATEARPPARAEK